MNSKPLRNTKIYVVSIFLLSFIYVASCTQNPNQSTEENVQITYSSVVEPLFDRVNSAYLSVTNSAMNIILDTVFTLDTPAGDIASFYINLCSGDHLVFRTWFYDDIRRPLYRTAESVNIYEHSPENIILQPVQTGFR